MSAADRMIRLLETLVEQGRQNQQTLSAAASPAQPPGGQPQTGPAGPPSAAVSLDDFPKPGAFSRPMSQKQQQALAKRHLKRPADVYGAGTNLLSAAKGIVPFAGDLAIGRARLRNLSEAYDNWKRARWAERKQQDAAAEAAGRLPAPPTAAPAATTAGPAPAAPQTPAQVATPSRPPAKAPPASAAPRTALASTGRATAAGSPVRKTKLQREQPIEGPPAPAKKTMVYPKQVVALKKPPKRKADPSVPAWQRRMKMTGAGGLKLTGGGRTPRDKARIGSGRTPQERASELGAGLDPRGDEHREAMEKQDQTNDKLDKIDKTLREQAQNRVPAATAAKQEQPKLASQEALAPQTVVNAGQHGLGVAEVVKAVTKIAAVAE